VGDEVLTRGEIEARLSGLSRRSEEISQAISET